MQNNNEDLMTVTDVAEYLNLRPKTVYNYVSMGIIPSLRLNRKCVRFRKSEIDLWLQNFHQKGRNTFAPKLEDALDCITSVTYQKRNRKTLEKSYAKGVNNHE